MERTSDILQPISLNESENSKCLGCAHQEHTCTKEEAFELESYFKLVSPPQGPDNLHLTKNLSRYFHLSNEQFIGDFETQDYRLHRGFIPTKNQVRLFYTRLITKTNSIATICIVHGFGEHTGRYIDFADHLAKKGFEVHMVDLQGFGYSGGARSAATVEEMHEDIEILLSKANKNLPLFIFAHSMGAALVATLLMRNPGLNISGVVMGSPLIDLAPRPNLRLKKWFIRNFGDIFEDVMLNTMINPNSLTKNNREFKNDFDDRLLMPLLSMKMAKTLLRLTEYIQPNAKKFKYPVFLYHGENDTLTSFSAAQNFFKKIPVEDKTIKMITEGRHELLHDFERNEVIDIIVSWITLRVNHAHNYGFHAPLCVGLESKRVEWLERLFILAIIVINLILLKKLRKAWLLKKNTTWALVPIYWITKGLSYFN